jgi:hypothetical protein
MEQSKIISKLWSQFLDTVRVEKAITKVYLTTKRVYTPECYWPLQRFKNDYNASESLWLNFVDLPRGPILQG